MPASALTWDVILEHCPDSCHEHSVQTFDGVASGSFPAPDHEYPSYLRLVLRGHRQHGHQHHRHPRPAAADRRPDLRDRARHQPRPARWASTRGAATPFTRTVIVGSARRSRRATQSAGGIELHLPVVVGRWRRQPHHRRRPAPTRPTPPTSWPRSTLDQPGHRRGHAAGRQLERERRRAHHRRRRRRHLDRGRRVPLHPPAADR